MPKWAPRPRPVGRLAPRPARVSPAEKSAEPTLGRVSQGPTSRRPPPCGSWEAARCLDKTTCARSTFVYHLRKLQRRSFRGNAAPSLQPLSSTGAHHPVAPPYGRAAGTGFRPPLPLRVRHASVHLPHAPRRFSCKPRNPIVAPAHRRQAGAPSLKHPSRQQASHALRNAVRSLPPTTAPLTPRDSPPA